MSRRDHMPGPWAPTVRHSPVMRLAAGHAVRVDASVADHDGMERYFRDARGGLFQPPRDDLALMPRGRTVKAAERGRDAITRGRTPT
jgi:hypothetical protein